MGVEDAEASLTIADIEEEEASLDICVEDDGAEIETVVEEQGTSESNGSKQIRRQMGSISLWNWSSLQLNV